MDVKKIKLQLMRRTAATRNVVQAGSPIRRRFRFLAIEFGLESDDANADPESRNLRPNWNFRILCHTFESTYIHTQRSVRTFSLASTQIVETKAPVFIKILVLS